MTRIDDRKGKSMIFIGITGGVGAGKSAVLDYLKKLKGVRVMLSDEIAHELMEPGSDCYNRLKKLFAEEPIWLEDGHFDRPANRIFLPYAITNFLGNILLFIPLGFFPPMLLKKMQKFWKTMLLVLGIMVTVEILQPLLQV